MSFVILIGAFPPPIHGASLVNEAIRHHLIEKKVKIKTINLSSNSFTFSFAAKIFRIFSVIFGLAKFLKIIFVCKFYLRQKITLYLGLSGSYGQIYELIFVLFARILKCSIFLHHHSFAYIVQKKCYFDLMSKVSGKGSQHIVLCDCMGKNLMMIYPSVNKIYSLSNTAVVDISDINIFPKKKITTIGFLGNISADKGIFEFIDVISKLSAQGNLVHAQIAGPFSDSKTKKLVFERISSLDNLKYVGAKYGESKKEFLNKIDLLLFPTKYVHEAEPLTILEAMSASVIIISYGRGCISDLISCQSGLVIDQCDNFVDRAVEQVQFWQNNPHIFQQYSFNSYNLFKKLKFDNDIKLENLINLLSSEY